MLQQAAAVRSMYCGIRLQHITAPRTSPHHERQSTYLDIIFCYTCTGMNSLGAADRKETGRVIPLSSGKLLLLLPVPLLRKGTQDV